MSFPVSLEFSCPGGGAEAAGPGSRSASHPIESIYGYEKIPLADLHLYYLPKIDQGEIYCIRHIRSGKRYIGQTKSMKRINGQFHVKGAADRVLKHFRLALGGSQDCPRFYEAIRAEGPTAPESFTWEILETTPLCLLNKQEKYYIKLYKSRWQRLGYNLAKGGKRRPRGAKR